MDLDVLYGQVGGCLRLKIDTESQEARELQSALPTGSDVRRVTLNSEVDVETLKVKHILDRQAADDLEFDMMYGFFLEASEVRARKML